MDWMACPSGTYSDVEGLYDEGQCMPCPGGQYCTGEHQTAPTGDCDQGMLSSLHILPNINLLFIVFFLCMAHLLIILTDVICLNVYHIAK